MSSPVNCLHNINEFLFVIHGPVNFVVISRPQINHDMLVAKEKHNCAWIIEFVHCVEIWYLQTWISPLNTRKAEKYNDKQFLSGQL